MINVTGNAIEMNSQNAAPWVRHLLMTVLLGAVLVLCYIVLLPFLDVVIWAAVLAYLTWPLHRRLRDALRGRATTSALAMTALLAGALVLPAVWIGVLVENEVVAAYQQAVAYLAAGPLVLPEAVRRVPLVGAQLQDWLNLHAGDPVAMQNHLIESAQGSSNWVLRMVGGAGRNVVKLLFTLITLFFFYRDAEAMMAQIRQVLRHLFGDTINRYIRAATEITKAVVSGLLVTALAQGALAGAGYWIVGVRAPVLFGMLTALVSIVPMFGTFLIWGPISGYLLLTNEFWPGIGLLAWGTLVVHPVDNVLRPLMISSATQIPFLLVMFGLLGGLSAFGLVGVFIGPASLAIAMALWSEALGTQELAVVGNPKDQGKRSC